MKKLKIILLTILGISNWFHSQEVNAAQLVDVAVVQSNNDAIVLELVGKVQTKDEIILSSYVDAHLTQLLLPGTKLHKGQVIAQMDTEFLIIQRVKFI